ncbi:5-methylcytosine restriction system specificity protein McrC [Macrococcus brunensis]|uniref:5-methylcytosine restriction system specificity protein McrC n=1 Tax=Macrococcus brunensis TaxID=198483 RepID=UPI001EF04127|nr:hypothetical protein [Macrococcus brunensis]ULG72396.1 hypothetical protein MGG12_02430 [Macrococcus brunensis]
MLAVFERFISNFYERETDRHVSLPRIYWKVGDGYTEALTIMQTDIVLKKGNRTIIIDTKFHQHNMTSHPLSLQNKKQISSNIYQIFAYLENYQKRKNETLSGMLLNA